jgi:hypothetical protein
LRSSANTVRDCHNARSLPRDPICRALTVSPGARRG